MSLATRLWPSLSESWFCVISRKEISVKTGPLYSKGTTLRGMSSRFVTLNCLFYSPWGIVHKVSRIYCGAICFYSNAFGLHKKKVIFILTRKKIFMNVFISVVESFSNAVNEILILLIIRFLKWKGDVFSFAITSAIVPSRASRWRLVWPGWPHLLKEKVVFL